MSMEGGVGLGFGGIVIRDRAGRAVLSAPAGRVGLDALSLLTLAIKVRRLELDGLDLRLRLRPDGALSIAAAADPTATTIELPAPAPSPSAAAPTAAAPDFGLAMFRIIDAMTGAGQALDRVALAHGHLEFENEALGKKTVYDDLALSFGKEGDAAAIHVSARGSAGRWSIDATARGGDAREVSLTARDLSLDEILLMHARHPPFEADMPISFKIEARLSANSAIQALQGRFTLGAGYFKLDDPDDEPFFVDEATGAFGWDAAAGRYRFNDLQLLSGATHIFAAGWLAPPTEEQAAWVSHLESNDTAFAPERPGEQPIVIDQTLFDARYLPRESRFVVDRLSVRGPTVNGEGSAEIRRARARGDAQDEYAGRSERRRRRSPAVAEFHQRRRARLVPRAHSRRTSDLRVDERGLGRRRRRRGGPQARRSARERARRIFDARRGRRSVARNSAP